MSLRNSSIVAAALCVALGLGASSCRDRNDGEELRRKLERRASARPARAAVSIGAIHHPIPADSGSSGPPYRVGLDGGGALEIREAYIVVAAVELHACVPGRDDYETPEGPLLNSLGDLLVPPTRAHVPSSSNRFGTPFVEELTGSFDRARIVGEISPPLAAYCRVAAVVAPADRDVANSSSLSTESIVGKSVLIRGRRRPTPADEWRSFEWTSDGARVFEFPARDPRSGESPLILASPDDEVMLLIDKRLGPSTFDVDPDAEDPAVAVLERIGESMAIYTY